MNVAALIRFARFGIGDGIDRLQKAYNAIEPFDRHAQATPLQAQVQALSEAEAKYRSIPELSILDFAPEEIVVSISDKYLIDGSAPIVDLIALLKLAKHFKPRVIFEIGTFFGSTARNIAINCPDATVHTIDLEDEFSETDLPTDDHHLIHSRQVGKAFKDTPEADRIFQHRGDIASYDLARIGSKVDFFFIDGSHTYDHVKNDTLRCLEIASDRSFFAWHDCDIPHEGVVRWLLELRSKGYPVVRVAKSNLAVMCLPHLPKESSSVTSAVRDDSGRSLPILDVPALSH